MTINDIKSVSDIGISIVGSAVLIYISYRVLDKLIPVMQKLSETLVEIQVSLRSLVTISESLSNQQHEHNSVMAVHDQRSQDIQTVMRVLDAKVTCLNEDGATRTNIKNIYDQISAANQGVRAVGEKMESLQRMMELFIKVNGNNT